MANFGPILLANDRTTDYDRQKPLSCVNDLYRPLCP